jgi:hypothetical protein
MNTDLTTTLSASQAGGYDGAVTYSRRQNLPALAVLGITAAVLLVGCSITPPSGPSGGTDGGTTSSEAPGDGDLGDFVTLPETFPSADVPIIDGDIAFAVDLGTGWSLVIPVADTDAAFADASTKLLGAGFENQIESTTTADGSFGVFTTDTYQINLTATDTADFGPAVSYVVVITG